MRDIQKIKSSVDILTVISGILPQKGSAEDGAKFNCPFHDEKTPSFSVSNRLQKYKCFGCDAKGDVIDFLEHYNGWTKMEAIKHLVTTYNLPFDLNTSNSTQRSEKDKSLVVLREAHDLYKSVTTENFIEKFANYRSISKESVKKFGISYAPDTWNFLSSRIDDTESLVLSGMVVKSKNSYYDRFRHRVMFPIWDADGNLVAFGGRFMKGSQTSQPDSKYINSPESLIFKKNQVLYGLNFAKKVIHQSKSVIVVEGYMDVIALHEHGYQNSVATMGTSLTTGHAEILKKYNIETAYLCFDGDMAGKAASLRAATNFDKYNIEIRVIDLPKGHDPDTYITEFGKESFDKLIKNAASLIEFKIRKIILERDLVNPVEQRRALREIYEILKTTSSETEREAYIVLVVDTFTNVKGVRSPHRIEMLESAIRKELLLKESENNQKANEKIINTLFAYSEGSEEGVLKAESELMKAAINSLKWQKKIFKRISDEMWLSDVCKEIAYSLKNPSAMEPLSPEAITVIKSNIIIKSEDQYNEDIIEELIVKLEKYWNPPILNLKEEIFKKLDQGIPLTEEDKKILQTTRK